MAPGEGRERRGRPFNRPRGGGRGRPRRRAGVGSDGRHYGGRHQRRPARAALAERVRPVPNRAVPARAAGRGHGPRDVREHAGARPARGDVRPRDSDHRGAGPPPRGEERRRAHHRAVREVGFSLLASRRRASETNRPEFQASRRPDSVGPKFGGRVENRRGGAEGREGRRSGGESGKGGADGKGGLKRRWMLERFCRFGSEGLCGAAGVWCCSRARVATPPPIGGARR
jgi:hypothetical protein